MKLIQGIFVFFLLIATNLRAHKAETIDTNDARYEPTIQKLIECVEKQNELLQTQIHGSRLFYSWSLYWALVMYVGFWQYEQYLNYRTSK